MALDSLKKTFKLDDFEIGHNLTAIMNSIIDSQFFESSYSNYGAFLPTLSLSAASAEIQNSEIFFEHSYYAIKSIELIANYLDKGPIKDLDFDEILLHNYIIRYIQDDGTTLYFDPQYTDNLEIILQNTYYMIYVLKAIEMYTLDDQKIKNFVEQNLDYTNIKNIYYSYKISEILSLEIIFDVELTYNLVQQIYSEELHEFYLTTDRRIIEQEAFLWICDMAKNDEIRINGQYTDPIMLGEYNVISASLCNIIIKDFGPYSVVKYESAQIGTIVLDKMPDNTFQKDIFIPVDPNNYPLVEGKICVYDGSILIKELSVSFQTFYNLTVTHIISNASRSVDIKVNVSLISGVGAQPLYDSKMYAEIYKDDELTETKYFLGEHIDYSYFTLNYTAESTGNYLLMFYLENPYEADPLFINETSFTVEGTKTDIVKDESSGSGSGSSSESELEADYQAGIPLLIAIISIPSCAIAVSAKLKRKSIINSKMK